MKYLSGAERIQADALKGRRCALLTNAGAVTADGTRVVDALQTAGINLTLLFSPEHGLAGTVADGVEVSENRDVASGLPVVSLYGKTKEIPQENLDDFDVMLIDLPDVGVRYYTYPDTVFKVLDSCARAGKGAIILDRANPLGKALEGPLLEDGNQSDVGRFPVPVRHGMTLGEYAKLAIQEFGVAPGIDLTVIPFAFEPACENPLFPDFERPWRNPSPNLRSFEALCCYPGTCLFEGTNLSEGRGTTAPFQLVGAPFVDAQALLKKVGQQEFPGLRLAPAVFTPDANKFTGEACQGIEFHVTDVRQCRSFEAALRVLDAVRDLYPDAFEFRETHFDHLLGSSRYRLGTESLEGLLSRAERECEEFSEKHYIHP